MAFVKWSWESRRRVWLTSVQCSSKKCEACSCARLLVHHELNNKDHFSSNLLLSGSLWLVASEMDSFLDCSAPLTTIQTWKTAVNSGPKPECEEIPAQTCWKLGRNKIHQELALAENSISSGAAPSANIDWFTFRVISVGWQNLPAKSSSLHLCQPDLPADAMFCDRRNTLLASNLGKACTQRGPETAVCTAQCQVCCEVECTMSVRHRCNACRTFI